MKLFKRPEPVTQEGKILKALKERGQKGMYNTELANLVGWHFHQRITDLRKDGHNILHEHLKGSFHKYTLLED